MNQQTQQAVRPREQLADHRKTTLYFGAGILILVVALGALWPLRASLLGRTGEAPSADDAESAAAKPDGLPENVVRLSDRQAAVAQLHVSPVGMREFQDVETVPGKTDYNAGQHLDVRAPADCVVKKILVEHGQMVHRSDHLVIVTSNEIGLAREEVLQREADLRLATKQFQRAEEIAQNVRELLAQLKDQPDPPIVEKQFEGKPLGDYRNQILSAYSKYILAARILANGQTMEEKGVFSIRSIYEWHNSQEVTLASFQSICDTSRFDSGIQRDKARNAMDHAQRLLEVSRERLASLLGSNNDNVEVSPGQELSELIIHSPFDGRVDERHVVESQRVKVGEPMLVLSNIDTVWVYAQIHERQWNALSVAEGQRVVVRSPAVAGEFYAYVKHVGPYVAPDTRAVSLVAEMQNAQHLFKPGMFVWVSIPVDGARQRLAVSTAAVVRHEEQPFVFVQESPQSFRRIDVKIGLETKKWVEITGGLAEGQMVVDRGAFVLKSELLLEGEAE